MRTHALALAVLAATSIAGCANFEKTVVQTLASANEAVATVEGAAHTAYQSGTIDKPTVKLIAHYVDVADDWSLSARCAYAKGDLTSTAGYLSAILNMAQMITATMNHAVLPAAVGAPPMITCAAPAPVGAVAVPAALMRQP